MEQIEFVLIGSRRYFDHVGDVFDASFVNRAISSQDDLDRIEIDAKSIGDPINALNDAGRKGGEQKFDRIERIESSVGACIDGQARLFGLHYRTLFVDSVGTQLEGHHVVTQFRSKATLRFPASAPDSRCTKPKCLVFHVRLARLRSKL